MTKTAIRDEKNETIRVDEDGATRDERNETIRDRKNDLMHNNNT